MTKLPRIKTITLLILSVGINTNIFAGANDKAKPMSDPQIEVLMNVPKLGKVILDKRGIPSHINGELGKIDPSNLQTDINAFQKNFGAIFRMDNSHHLAIKKTIEDSLGMRHFRTQQYINNRKVIGGQLIFHTDATSNKILSVSGKYLSSSVHLPLNEKIKKGQIEKLARDSISRPSITFLQEPELVYLFDKEGHGILAWILQAEYTDAISLKQIDNVFINAISGKIIEFHPQLHRVLNREVWDSNLSQNASGNTLLINEGGSSSDSAAQKAYDYTGVSWNYFQNKHSIDSYDNAGHIIHTTVHYSAPPPLPFAPDAFWNGDYIVFGDGDGTNYGDPSEALDVVAHEFTHALTENTANLIYLNESGALNEAMSDIFAASAEAFDSGLNANTWLFGENWITPNATGDAVRYMANPTADGISTDYYPERYIGSEDLGGVHRNSGILNLSYYLLVNGGIHPRFATNIPVTGIGISKAEKIYFRALTLYMTPNESFEMARDSLAHAASDLYGQFSNETMQLCNSLDAVGINGSGTGYCDLTISTDLHVEYIGCSPQNSPRYFVSWYSGSSIIEYDVDFKRNSAAWNSFYNGTQISSIFTDEQYATSYIRARANTIIGWGSYDQAYLGPKTCNGGPLF